MCTIHIYNVSGIMCSQLVAFYNIPTRYVERGTLVEYPLTEDHNQTFILSATIKENSSIYEYLPNQYYLVNEKDMTDARDKRTEEPH